MKQNKGIVAVALFFTLLLPASVAAQMYSSDSGDSRWYRWGSSDLRQKISALPDAAVQSVPIPVLFGVNLRNISPNFGDPRSGGRTHAGEDIMAVKGTPIVSPTEAVVLRTGVGPSEGNYVYTANPGDETFVYMHLDTIGEGVVSGTVLQKGSLIGYVGNTGNASGGAAHLHFEIHNSSGTPTDPFPRLSSEFTPQEKMSALTTILTQTTDSAALARFLVTSFRGTFSVALGENIAVPQLIISTMATAPASSAGSVTIPSATANVTIGSSGSQVTALQNYLVRANKGPAALRLKDAGATGYFGQLTKGALFEFQIAVGLNPPNGNYDAPTRDYITSHPLGGVVLPSTPTPTTPPPAALALPRELSRNMTGTDVRTLQKLLNTRGFLVATAGAGSPGNESTFFGPATEAAVKKFQITNGIAPASGVVGVTTRTALGSL